MDRVFDVIGVKPHYSEFGFTERDIDISPYCYGFPDYYDWHRSWRRQGKE